MARSTSPLAAALAKADADFRAPMADEDDVTRPVPLSLLARIVRQSDPTIRLCLDLPVEKIQVDDEAEPKKDRGTGEVKK